MYSVIINREMEETEVMNQVIFGKYFHCLSFDEFETVIDGFIAVYDGKIVGAGPRTEYAKWNHPHKHDLEEVELTEYQFLLPGFIDTHIHAPQYPNIGLGLDMELMDWLDTYTFPTETEFKDEHFAKSVYEKVVRKTIDNGTTTASYFATIHLRASEILADEIKRQGQRAFVGKVSLDQNCPGCYSETLNESIRDNVSFIEYVIGLKTDLIKPIITPRFAITCSNKLMLELGHLAQKFDLPIQSHISENLNEIKFTAELFPNSKNYADVYDKCNLLNSRCIMAHGVHLTDDEVKLFSERKVAVSHCPTSNIDLRSGLCDVKRLMEMGVTVGLGTDVSGGHRISILETIRSTLDVSHCLNFAKKQNIQGTGKVSGNETKNGSYVPLDYMQGIYLATLGGAKALNIDSKVGNFLVGKDFDAIVVDVSEQPIDTFKLPKSLTEKLSSQQKFHQKIQKFIYVGDDRNVFNVFVKGKQVKKC